MGAVAGRCGGSLWSDGERPVDRSAFEVALPHAARVADPFHVVRLANDALAAVGADTRTWDKTAIT